MATKPFIASGSSLDIPDQKRKEQIEQYLEWMAVERQKTAKSTKSASPRKRHKKQPKKQQKLKKLKKAEQKEDDKQNELRYRPIFGINKINKNVEDTKLYTFHFKLF